MRKLLELVLEANDYNTMMEDPYRAIELLDNQQTTTDQIQEYMEDWNGPVGRNTGGMIFFVELEEILGNINPFI
jgi:hypothetical protein